jgi:hypothetical protein
MSGDAEPSPTATQECAPATDGTPHTVQWASDSGFPAVVTSFNEFLAAAERMRLLATATRATTLEPKGGP